MKRSLPSLCALAGIASLFVAAPAFALDGYRDRAGIFYGGGLGFGAGKPDTKGAETKATFNAHGRVGGGITSNLTLDFDLGLGMQLGKSTSLQTGFVGLNLFPAGDLYLRVMGGIAHASVDDSTGQGGGGATGMGAGLGLGYEFFANADMAVGIGVDYQHHFYDRFDFSLLNFGLTFLVY